MTSRDFAYWLQGFFEISGSNVIDVGQVELIKNHLNLVFKHEIDPSLNVGKTGEEVKELQDVHDGKMKKPTPPPTQIIHDGQFDPDKMIKDGPPPKKDQNAVDWLRDKYKPGKLHGGWESGSSDNTLYRC